MSELRLMTHMIKTPGWHFGLDLVEAKLASRLWVYHELTELEELGLVERRNDPDHSGTGIPRQQFRSLVGFAFKPEAKSK